MKTPIDAQDEATWPAALVESFEAGLGILRSFEEEERRVERLAERNISVRCNPPRNPHRDARRSIIEAADRALRSRDLLAFHCSNLHPAEIDSVMRDGLDPLDREMVARRVRARVAAGDIPEPVGTRLLAETMAGDENRAGLLWLIFTRSTLKDWSGVYRLLTYWGGEALYAPHEDDPVVGAVLARMGRSAIIEVAAPVSHIECFMSVSERLLIGYLSRRDVETGHAPEFEGYVKTRIVGRRVRRVIGPDDPDFSRLTGRNPGDPNEPIFERRRMNWKLIS